MNTSTLTAIINAFGVASKDATRFALQNVLIEREGDLVAVVATDGHHLSRFLTTDTRAPILVERTEGMGVVMPMRLP
jgi:DNA polymerase III sliding clamp (beta) subunit (PCNA family)